jgi:hypothetical protein
MTIKKLSIGYSTQAISLGQLSPLVERADREIVLVVENPGQIAWQGQGLGQLMLREDLQFAEVSNSALDKILNLLIDTATGRYLVFAAGDHTFNPAGLDAAIKYLDQKPLVAALVAKASNSSDELEQGGVAINGAVLDNVNANQLVLRLSAIRGFGTRFPESQETEVANSSQSTASFLRALLAAGGQVEEIQIALSVG